MEETRFWALLAKKQFGEASPEEQLELMRFIDSHPEYADLADEAVSAEAGITFPPCQFNPDVVEQKWDAFASKAFVEPTAYGKRVSNRFSRYFFAAAASILLMLVAGWWLKNRESPEPPGELVANVISTGNGIKKKVVLPDSTLVWLNVNSRISFPQNFGDQERKIELEGEAFFDVAHNAQKPFIIHTEKMDIRVLGTAFDIKAYKGDKVHEASVIRGVIEVSILSKKSNKHNTITLKKSEKILVKDEADVRSFPVSKHSVSKTKDVEEDISEIAFTKLTTLSSNDTTCIETGWVANKFLFRSKPFPDLVKDMERWFDTKIIVKNKAILDRKFTGSFVNEDIVEALRLLQSTFAFQFKFDKTKNEVLIY